MKQLRCLGILWALFVMVWCIAPAKSDPLSDLSDPDHPLPRPIGGGDGLAFYPASAMKAGMGGDVLLAFSLDAAGRPTHPAALWSDSEEFEKGALAWLQNFRFAVPRTWASDTDSWRRFRIMVHFRVGEGCRELGHAAPLGIVEVAICKRR
jgi:TonB family protein